ncbi:RDD family protein [Alteromonas lipotrueiana]|uniref:RDD family protein n=1 Tax=Alteromonas lipotrueiana TaxID=2803815 RepID=UPI001C468CAC
MTSPNYTDYSLAELREALLVIDADAYPERAAQLKQRISEAQAAHQERLQNDAELDEINDIQRFAVARRRERFAAALIDMLVNALATIPFWIIASPLFQQLSNTEQNDLSVLTQAFFWGLGYGILMFVILNGYLIATRAQTIGKYFLNIQVQTLNSQPATFSRYVFRRHLPILLAYSLPVVGAGIALVDILFIFGKPRRCLHDHVANTQVGYIAQPK